MDKKTEVIVSGEHDLINKAIIDELESDVIVLDKDLRIILMNTAAEKRWGVKFDDIRGLNYLSLRIKLTSREILAGLEKVIDGRNTLNIKGLQYLSQDSQKRFIDLSYIPLLDRNNEVRGIVSIGKDVALDIPQRDGSEKTETLKLTERFKELEVSSQQYSEQIKELTSQLSQKEFEVQRLQHELKERYKFYDLIGKNHLMQKVYKIIERVSEVDTTVLILGETGAGKELAAKAIHYNSSRRNNGFIAVNCAALPETLLESELFGHVKGAFTGAIQDRKGKFEMADRGTLFLDEIGEISLSTQVKLLRVLQEREIEKLGDEKKIKVDIRIIAATNQDLPALIERGRFRRDIYYRLNVISVKLPPLREKKDDIPLLVSFFIEKLNKKFNKKFSGVSPYALNKLMMYSWPGNVRELESVIERAMIMADTEIIEDVDVLVDSKLLQKDILLLPEHTSGLRQYKNIVNFMENYEKEYFVSVFEEFRGKINDIARFTNLNRRTILNKMKKFNIQKNKFQEREQP